MKTSRLILLAIVCACTMAMSAQDAQLFGERDITGTARYVSMAGAMASVGADPSAVMDNPAGLGLYRRLEVSLTLQEMLDYNRQIGEKERFSSCFTLPQASFVFAFENRNRTSALKYCNFMFSFNRLKSYNRSSMAYGTNQPSIANLMLEQVMPPNSQFIMDERTMSQIGYNSPSVGWLSCMGYWCYMIDPVMSADSSQTVDWYTNYGGYMPRTALRVEESGYVDEFSLHWAGNINHRFHIGVGLNIRSLYYTKRTLYEESFPGDYGQDYMQQSTYLRQTGIGFSGTLGVIYQPFRFWRMGLSCQSPVAMRINTNTYGNMVLSDTYLGRSASEESLEFYNRDIRLTSPLRTTVGMTFLLQDKAMLSLQYDYRYWRDTRDVHTIKLGIEGVIAHNFFLNAGYACESDFISKDRIFTLAYNDVRMDADFRNIGLKHFLGTGFGYRNNHFIVQLGYQYCHHTYRQYPFATQNPGDNNEYTADYTSMVDQTHRIVFTFAWHTRD